MEIKLDEIKLEKSQFDQLNTNVIDTLLNNVQIKLEPELQPPVLNRKNIARYFGVAESTIRYWVNELGCPYVDIDGRKLYNKERINDWINKHEKSVKK